MKVKTIELDPEIWLRGKEADYHGSYLLHPDTGKMCCIGIALNQCRVPKKYLKGSSTVDELIVDRLGERAGGGLPKWTKPDEDEDGFCHNEPCWIRDAYEYNDDPYLDDDERLDLINNVSVGKGIRFVLKQT